MKKQNDHEELLTGGNVSNVYRSGDTVRREVKSDNINIRKLLKHLEKKNFSYAPKFLGVDEQGREVLSFIDGVAGHDPLKEYMCTHDVLKEIASMLRLYHDAVQDFSISDDWERMDNTPNNIEVVCHNDFAMYNIIFKDKKPVGIIDFDVAAPGPRLWDIAYTLYTCVPLSRFFRTETGEVVNYLSLDHADQIKHRVKLFFESYGEEIAEDYLDMVLLRLEGICQYMKRQACEGDIAFQNMIQEGHLEHYQKDIQFIHEHRKEWM
ncbi:MULTISPECIES: phosphotransferase [unclassified Bacillus (in: firmicutes)]|uniref:phosphotransferase n=1 Tax=unclassified Bacillus (in: firmicutes) TaxID=185979 RepID=UPI0030FC5F7F